jgi:hypothetical protein
MHALYKIRKHIDFHCLRPKIAGKIFDGVISLILLCNSEVCGAYIDNDFTKWDKSFTEKNHLKYLKLYLGVNRKASNVASRGELGRFALLFPMLKCPPPPLFHLEWYMHNMLIGKAYYAYKNM